MGEPLMNFRELYREVTCLPSRLGEKLYSSGPGKRLAYFFYKTAASLRPGWFQGQERFGNSLLNLNRFDEGMAQWQKAISLQKADRYSALYQQSISLLHRGEWDTTMKLLEMGVEAQEQFSKEHQLDRLGIRFLREWTHSIGHLALLDTYVKMGILGWRLPFRPVVLAPKVANRSYLEYWRQYLPDIITDPVGVDLITPLAERLEDHIHVFRFADGRKMNYMAAILTVQKQWEAEGRGPLLTLNDSDEKRGWEYLERFGMRKGDWFVGLHVRDAADKNNRDSDISAYNMAIKTITNRGGWVIRMGNPSMPPIPAMSRVIDYAHDKSRSDVIDVFLWARSRFFIGTQSGPYMVPYTFGVPCLLTNSFPMGLPLPYQTIHIYKLYFLEKETRLLTFSEARESSAGLAESRKYLSSIGIKLIDNTPEEINDAVIEMLERLEGKLIYSVEDEQLQQRFKILKPPVTNQPTVSTDRVGRAFLQKYSRLL
jgi:putative glycosyltransferase (TIGR04372 family)